LADVTPATIARDVRVVVGAEVSRRVSLADPLPGIGCRSAFGNDYYRIPTPAEQRAIVDTWNAQQVEGLLTYTWDKSEPDTLSMHPELWGAYAG
jgi:hypothetical protein